MIIKAEGHKATIMLSDNYLEILRNGFWNKHSITSKKITIKNISAIQFKPAGFMENGYILFSFIGEIENRIGLFLNGTINENMILFSKSQQSQFEKIKEELEKKIYK